jgi:hypothetical protein
MRIFLGLMMWTIPLAAIAGLSGCDPADGEFEKKFTHEAMLVKTCGVDEEISKVPLRVYRYDGKLWFKENSKWWQIDAGIDKVCDVLDVDVQNGIRRSHEDHHQPRIADLFTWRTRLVSGSFHHQPIEVKSADQPWLL